MIITHGNFIDYYFNYYICRSKCPPFSKHISILSLHDSLRRRRVSSVILLLSYIILSLSSSILLCHVCETTVFKQPHRTHPCVSVMVTSVATQQDPFVVSNDPCGANLSQPLQCVKILFTETQNVRIYSKSTRTLYCKRKIKNTFKFVLNTTLFVA